MNSQHRTSSGRLHGTVYTLHMYGVYINLKDLRMSLTTRACSKVELQALICLRTCTYIPDLDQVYMPVVRIFDCPLSFAPKSWLIGTQPMACAVLTLFLPYPFIVHPFYLPPPQNKVVAMVVVYSSAVL